MALFSSSESVYLASFLSAVDLDSSISPDGSVDPGVADRVPHLQGSEALTKATKDLMALDVPVSSSSYHHAPHQQHPNHVERNRDSAPNYWPTIGPSDAPTALSSALRYGTPGVRSSSPANYLAGGFSSSISPSDASRSAMLAQPGSSSSSLYATHPASQPHLQIAPLRGFDPPTASSSNFTLPPIATAGLTNGVGAQLQQSPSRPSPLPSSASAPSVLANTPTSASVSASAKRPLPTTLQTSADPGSAKRVRRSPSSTPFSPTSATGAPDADAPGPKPRRSVSGTSKGSPAASGSGSGNGNGGGANNNKGTLLSPSQKRANHIQSEQKRRANIRRGYEALCDAVPALREAIRAEDERERKDAQGPDDAGGGGGGSGKGKARAGAGAEKGKKKKGRAEGDKPDGRAGPRSENVVLQKTIDYITGLLTEQASLKQRMDLARGMLPLGHPALPVDPRYMDPTGVPLWEREWNGGMDLDLGGDGAGDGSEDEG